MKPQFLPFLPLFFSIPLLAASPPEQTVEIKTLTAQMRYDTPEFSVPPGTPLHIIFSNGDVAHFRPSGNADEFRMYAVADSAERAAAIVARGVAEPDGIVRQMERTLVHSA